MFSEKGSDVGLECNKVMILCNVEKQSILHQKRKVDSGGQKGRSRKEKKCSCSDKIICREMLHDAE